MSRAVTIPANANPWTCEINGKKYSYEAGKTETVPDEVAALIDNITALAPVPAPEARKGSVWTKTESGADWEKLPQGAAVSDAAGDAPTAEEFNGLLESLRDAGIVAKGE